jgi:hypothetical protein
MIIKFSKNVELKDWELVGDGIQYRSIADKTFNRRFIMIVIIEEYKDNDICYISFGRDPLSLEGIIPSEINGDLEFAKNSVDNFLIRMSGLTVFM